MCSKAQGDAVRHETIRFTQLLFASFKPHSKIGVLRTRVLRFSRLAQHG